MDFITRKRQIYFYEKKTEEELKSVHFSIFFIAYFFAECQGF